MAVKARTTREAAAAVGITRATLQAWIAAKKICPPRPTTFGNMTARIWSDADIRDLGEAKKRLYRKGRGRKSVS